MTLGITPARAATAYRYIEPGKRVRLGHRVRRFVEKTNADEAAAYLVAGTFAWDAGTVVWRGDGVVGELDAFAPDIMGRLREAIAQRRPSPREPARERTEGQPLTWRAQVVQFCASFCGMRRALPHGMKP